MRWLQLRSETTALPDPTSLFIAKARRPPGGAGWLTDSRTTSHPWFEPVVGD